MVVDNLVMQLKVAYFSTHLNHANESKALLLLWLPCLYVRGK